HVTGVQTCALPICPGFAGLGVHPPPPARTGLGPPCCRAVVRPVAASPGGPPVALCGPFSVRAALWPSPIALCAVRARLAPLARCCRRALAARAGSSPVAGAPPGERP